MTTKNKLHLKDESPPTIFQFDGTLLVSDFQPLAETADTFSMIQIDGQIKDVNNQPISSALVEVWNTRDAGIYGMIYEPSFVPVDPDGQNWQCIITEGDGHYQFQIEHQLPRQFSDSINFKITDEYGNVKLTRMYLFENRFHPKDPFLINMELEERHLYFGTKNVDSYRFDILF